MTDNPQAFPLGAASFGPAGDIALPQDGMTLRDWFAGQALAMSQPDSPKELAEWAYCVAGAMLERRQTTDTARKEGN